MAVPVWQNARVQAAGFGVDEFGQRVDVGGFELGEFAVFEDFARQLVQERQLFEHVRGGRAGFPSAPSAQSQTHFVE